MKRREGRERKGGGEGGKREGVIDLGRQEIDHGVKKTAKSVIVYNTLCC